MNFRLTAILFAVVLALVVGLLIYALTTGDPAVADGGPFAALTAANVKPDDITAVELTRTSPKDETLAFAKKDGRWRLTSPADAGVDGNALDALVRDLLAATSEKTAGPVERVNTGLSRPEVTVTLKTGDKSAAVHIGKTTFGQDQAITYMVSAADPNALPMAVLTRNLRTSLFRPDAKDGLPATMVKWRTDFRPRALLAGEVNNAESESDAVTLSRGDKTLSLARTDGEWRVATPALGRADANGASEPDPSRFTGVRPLLNAVLLLRISTADVTEDVPTDQLGTFGLAPADNPLKVTYTAKGKPAQTLFIGKRLTDKDGKPAVPPRYHVKLDGDAAVFLVSTNQVEQLTNTLNDPTSLLNRDLFPPSKLAQIDAVDSTFGGGFKLRKLSGGVDTWGVYGGGEPVEAQMQAVQNVLNRLSAPRVATEVLAKPDDAAFDGDSLQVKLKVWANGVDKAKAKLTDGKLPPEPPVTGDPVELWIGKPSVKNVTRPDGTTEERKVVVVRRIIGKETTDLEVPLDVVALALQPRVKFINARLPSFVPAQATGLVLFRDGKRTEYAKNPAALDPAYRQSGVWNAGDSKGPVADGDGVLDLLTKLASLSPAILMEKADDLKALGLDPANPKMSAKVTLPGQKETRTEEFQFGEPVKGDDKSVYFKAVDRSFVYAVPAELAARVRTADLSDKVVFRLDPTRVKQVTLRGWPATTADKTPAKIVAELQNGAWVATEPKGANLDVVTLSAWVNALQFPKSVGPAPVEPGKEPPAAYGFGLDAVKLFVVSKGEKEGDPDVGLDLTLGATTADLTGIYARLSDGRCFLLDASPFRLLLPRPPLAAK